MADTSNQNNSSRKTLQDDINYQISAAGGNSMTLIIRSKTGDCAVPAYTNVRLYNCEINSLNIQPASIVYLKDCIVKGDNGVFTVTNAAILAEGTKWDARVVFTGAKVELNTCTISQSLLFTKSSFLKSFANTWKAGTGQFNKFALLADELSRIESYKDSWDNWSDYFWVASNKSFVKVTSPSSITQKTAKGGYSIADTSSVVVLDHALELSEQSTKDLFTATNGSRFEIYNIPSIISDAGISNLTDSKAIVREVDTITTKNAKLCDITNSFIEFSNVDKFQADSQSAFEVTNSIVNFVNTTSIKSKSNAIKTTNSNINFIFQPIDYKDSNNSGSSIESTDETTIDATNSSIFFKNVRNIKSTKTVIKLKDSSLRGTSISNILGGSTGFIIDSNGSDINLTNVDNIKGTADNGLNLLNGSRCTLNNVTTILNQGGLAGVYIDNSTCILKNVDTIKGKNYGIQLLNGGKLVFKNITTLIDGSRGGISVGKNCVVLGSDVDTIGSDTGGNGIDNTGDLSRIELKNVKNIIGHSSSGTGVSITGADFTLDNTGVPCLIKGNTGVSLVSGNNGTYKATFKGPITVKPTTPTGTALNASAFEIEEKGVKWDGDVSISESIVNGKFVKVTGNLTGVKSQLDYTTASFDKDVNLFSYSNLSGNRINIDGDTIVDFSVLDLLLSKMKSGKFSNRAGIFARSSNTEDITLDGSFSAAFGGQTGTLKLTNKSSGLGVASQQVNIQFAVADDPYTNSIGYFVNSGGDLSFEAEEKINMEADKLVAKFRDTIDITAQNLVSITSVSNNIDLNAINGSEVKTATTITLTATSQISATVGGHSVTITAAGVALV